MGEQIVVNNPKISFIVPVHNSANTIQKCIDSIILQGYDNVEIICINNGSTDNSLQLLYDLYNNNDKIIIKNLDIIGVSNARNFGISLVSGDYFKFVDSDDYLVSKTIEILVHDAVISDADIVLSNYIIMDNGVTSVIKSTSYPGKYSIKEYMKNFLHFSTINNNIGTKLYKTQYFRDLRFDTKYSITEDIKFYLEALKKSSNVYYSNIEDYVYVKNTSSLMHNYKKNYLDANIELINVFFGTMEAFDIPLTEHHHKYVYTSYINVLKNELKYNNYPMIKMSSKNILMQHRPKGFKYFVLETLIRLKFYPLIKYILNV